MVQWDSNSQLKDCPYVIGPDEALKRGKPFIRLFQETASFCRLSRHAEDTEDTFSTCPHGEIIRFGRGKDIYAFDFDSIIMTWNK